MKLLVVVILLAAAANADLVCDGFEAGFYPDVYDCQGFIECDEKGNSYRHSCPEGQWFDRNNIECTWSELLHCEPLPNPEAPPSCPTSGTSNLPWLGDCMRYYMCVNGERFEMSCGPGTEFDTEALLCREEIKAVCNRCPLVDVPGTLVFLPDKTDCEKYFLCRNFVQIPMVCDKDLHFNENNYYCEAATQAKCRYAKNNPFF